MNLLTNPFFSVAGPGANLPVKLTLPELLARLGNVTAEASLPLLPAHSQHVVHVFLCQVAAMALARAEKTGVTHSAEDWLDMLSGLSEHPTAWDLVVEDHTLCAFFQVPAVSGLANYVDQLDGIEYLEPLVLGRSHDIKRSRGLEADAEQWIYALISGQTSGAYTGPKSVPVMRMNGGWGSRTVCAVYTSLDLGTKFREDVTRLLAHADTIADEFGFAPNGVALLWTLPWDGSPQVQSSSLHPYAIEVCRRVRLRIAEGHLVLSRATASKGPIHGQKERHGVVGDPWTMVSFSNKGATALSLSENGFHVELVSKLLSSRECKQPVAMQCIASDEAEVFLEMTALARGNKGTSGFHHKVIPIPGRYAVDIFSGFDAHSEVKQRFARRSELGTHISRNASSQGVIALEKLLYPTQDESKKKREKKKTSHHFAFTSAFTRFEETEHLNFVFQSLDSDSDTAYETAWVQHCMNWVRKYIDQHARALCPRPALRYEARTHADQVLSKKLVYQEPPRG